MREAMARAEVGDEQEREDPTVLELERRTAELLGHEEAVYLPTATMGNQIALSILGERGTELIVEEKAHIMISELAGAALHAGLQTRPLKGHLGRISVEQVEETGWADGDFWTPRVSVLALENTQTRPAARSGRWTSCARSSPRPASAASARTSTARAC